MRYSPLRYPGGKAKVLNFMKALLAKNSFTKPAYIEPYAGGAAVALGLLLDKEVSEIHLNDKDLGIYSFWKHCVKQYPHKLITTIRSIPIDIDEWRKQAAIYKNPNSEEGFELGFATFFLNRCNHSGVIKGGAIGGIEQKGHYKIDSRFNREYLARRIETVSAYRDHIHIYKEDAKDFLRHFNTQTNSLFYLDPPYYGKGYQLYKHFYNQKDHAEVANEIRSLKGRWILSYDNHPQIRELYKWVKEEQTRAFHLTYSTSVKRGKEIMYFSPDIHSIPDTALI